MPPGFFTSLEGNLPGARGVNAHHWPVVACLARDDLRDSLQPLSLVLFVAIIMASVPLAFIGSVAALVYAGQAAFPSPR